MTQRMFSDSLEFYLGIEGSPRLGLKLIFHDGTERVRRVPNVDHDLNVSLNQFAN